MVQFKISSSLLIAITLLVASVIADNSNGKPVITVRDLVDHEFFNRNLQYRYHHLISRAEIEHVFGRELDTELTTFLKRRDTDHYDDIYARHPEQYINFFQCIGDFVKRCANGYWNHMIRKARAIIGQDHGELEAELNFLPREPEDLEFDSRGNYEQEHEHAPVAPPSQTDHGSPKNEPIVQRDSGNSWFSRALINYRDKMLEYTERQHDEDIDELD